MICFCWDGFPQYAARCILAFVTSTEERVVVVATHPDVPIKGMKEACGCEVFWIERGEKRSLKDITGELPRCVFLGGWNIPAFICFRDEVRGSGGRSIAMCDNNWILTPIELGRLGWWRTCVKELLKSIRFRIKLISKYDGFFVPGHSGVRLLRFYGVPREKIAMGLYSADATLFTKGEPLMKRDRKMIYVGQFIERKNVRRLIRAFAKANVKKEWTLDMYGSGPLKDEMVGVAKRIGGCAIHIHDFLQPEALSAKYRAARIFCLPSLLEHWGLVVHEAALSGCVLLLGNRTGAADDLLGCNNGRQFNSHSMSDMIQVFAEAMGRKTDEELMAAQKESLELAKRVNLQRFVDGVRFLCGNRVD